VRCYEHAASQRQWDVWTGSTLEELKDEVSRANPLAPGQVIFPDPKTLRTRVSPRWKRLLSSQDRSSSFKLHLIGHLRSVFELVWGHPAPVAPVVSIAVAPVA